MSNNHSLERGKIAWPLALLSNVLIAFGLLFMANGIGAILMALYLGGKPDMTGFVLGGPNATLMKNALLVGQIGGTLIGMVILPLLYIFFLKKELQEIIFKPSWKQILSFMLAAVSITFIIMPLIGIIGDWNKDIQLPSSWGSIATGMRAMEDKAAQVTKLIVAYNSTGEMIVVLFTVALLPAVAEELVFRGILLNDLTKTFNNVHVSVFVSAFVFSFIHFQFFGFFPRLLLGIVLGYLYITSGNILISMLMHFTNNAVVVLALNLHAKGVLKIDPESSKDLPAETIYISIILSSALFYACWRMYKLRIDTEKTNV
jgi:membrane protease YdiL (CAAX protease family)